MTHLAKDAPYRYCLSVCDRFTFASNCVTICSTATVLLALRLVPRRSERVGYKRGNMARKFCFLILAAVFASFMATAQVNATGALQGRVTDRSGAVVPNAEVKILDKETGATRSVVQYRSLDRNYWC
jgi:hypothetical protein